MSELRRDIRGAAPVTTGGRDPVSENNCFWSQQKGFTKILICGIMERDMAKKNNTKRKLVGLVSEESGVRAYYTKKNTMNTPDKLSLKKYDPKLRKHVLFVETKKNLGRNEVKEKKR